MKFLFVASAVLVVNLVSPAQVPEAATKHGLTVIAQKWHRDFHNPQLDDDQSAESGTSPEQAKKIFENEQNNARRRAAGLPNDPLPPKQPEVNKKPETPSVAYFYEVKIRNDSGKDVHAVTWEYIFVASDTGKEVGRRRFESKETIGTGKSKTLVSRSSIPPTGTIDIVTAGAKTPEKYTERILIISVEYADGSKWAATTSGSQTN